MAALVQVNDPLLNSQMSTAGTTGTGYPGSPNYTPGTPATSPTLSTLGGSTTGGTSMPSAPGGSRTDTQQNPPPATSGVPTMTTDPTTGQAVWTTPGQTNTSTTTGAGTGYQAPNYPTLNPAAPTRYLYINGVLQDRYDASSPYYLSPDAYPNLPNTTTQYSAPWQASQTYTPSYASPAGTGQLAAGYQAPAWSLPSWDPISQAQQAGIPQSQAYGNYLNSLGNGNYIPTSGGQQQQSQTGSTQNNNTYLQQLLSQLFGTGQSQYSTVKTPLGYTQYQNNVPQSSNSQGMDPMTQLILGMLMGQNNQGGSQNSFWNLLSGLQH